MISGSSLADGSDPAPPVDASFQPALQGHVRTGAFAEVGIRLVSSRDGPVRIDHAGADGRSSTSITLRAGQPRSIWLPYRADLTKALVFRVLFEGTVAQVHEMRSIRPAAPGVPLVVAASARKSDRRADSRFGGGGAIRIGVADLPRTLQGFDPVTELVLDVSVFTRLDGPQLSALEAFIADCGRLTIADLPERAKPKIQNIAGCGGAFVRFTTRTPAMALDVGPDLHTEKPPFPSASDLSALAPDDGSGSAFVQLGVFLGAYGLLMVVVAVAGRPIASVLVPIGTAAVALLLWSGRAPGVSSVLWLESQPGQERARFAAVIDIRGQGLGAAEVSLPSDARLDPFPNDALHERSVDGSGRVSASLTVPTRLLTRSVVRFTGTVPMTAPVSVTATEDRLSIRNSGPTETPPGYVVWNGQTFRLPGLQPAAAWAPAESSAVRMPPELRRVAGVPVRTAFVLEHVDVPPALLGGVGSISAWLMIRNANPMEPRP